MTYSEKTWEKPFKDRKEAKAALSPLGLAGHICWLPSALFAVFGGIGDALNVTLGLEPTS